MSAATCDRCGPSVEAKVVVRLPSGKKLTFCQHCANRYQPAIIKRCARR